MSWNSFWCRPRKMPRPCCRPGQVRWRFAGDPRRPQWMARQSGRASAPDGRRTVPCPSAPHSRSLFGVRGFFEVPCIRIECSGWVPARHCAAPPSCHLTSAPGGRMRNRSLAQFLAKSSLIPLVAAIGLFAVSNASAGDPVYKWKDANGQSHYSQQPPDKGVKFETITQPGRFGRTTQRPPPADAFGNRDLRRSATTSPAGPTPGAGRTPEAVRYGAQERRYADEPPAGGNGHQWYGHAGAPVAGAADPATRHRQEAGDGVLRQVRRFGDAVALGMGGGRSAGDWRRTGLVDKSMQANPSEVRGAHSADADRNAQSIAHRPSVRPFIAGSMQSGVVNITTDQARRPVATTRSCRSIQTRTSYR